MRLLRIALLVVAGLAVPLEAAAQAPYPPNTWHPYRGGTNCVQVADAQGNFNCSPLVTIDPATGAFNSVLGGPISRALTLVIGPSNNTFSGLANDLVIVKSDRTAVAPTGPGIGALTLRVRPSPRIPGYCNVVAIAGNSFGVEYPMAFLNPAYPFIVGAGAPFLYDQYLVDLPGGPGGC